MSAITLSERVSLHRDQLHGYVLRVLGVHKRGVSYVAESYPTGELLGTYAGVDIIASGTHVVGVVALRRGGYRVVPVGHRVCSVK